MTAALSLGPTTTFRPRPGDEDRSVLVFANLLPDEVVAARRLRALKRRLLFGIVGLWAVLVGIYGLSIYQTDSASSDLSDVQAQGAALTHRLNDYAPLLSAQAKSAAIGSTLSTLMANDLSWRDLIQRVQKQTQGAITVTTIAGAVTDASTADPGAAGAGLDALNSSGDTIVGTLTVVGTARDDRSIAGFVERLGRVTGVTAPLPASVTDTTGTRTFTVNALITSKALGGRFTAAATTPTGGK